MKKTILLLLVAGSSYCQSLAPLTVEKIMRDPKWMGVSPSNPFWSDDSKIVYFNWNPDRYPGDSLYSSSLADRAPRKVAASVRRNLPARGGSYNRTFSRKTYEKNGDIYLLDLSNSKVIQITSTAERESNPVFSGDEKKILFTMSGNLYSWEIGTGTFAQLTDLRKGRKSEARGSEQEKWLRADQLAYFDILKKRSENRKAADQNLKADRPTRPKEIYLDDRNADQIQLSPDGKYITYRLSRTSNVKTTIVPSYVTESGFTEDIQARSKVGAQQTQFELMVYDLAKDTVVALKTENIPGIMEVPAFRKDYPAKPAKDNKPAKAEPRAVTYSGPLWSDTGKNNVVVIQSVDNKDRWLVSLDLAGKQFKLIDRQHDDAWIGGPAAGFGTNTTGWINDNTLWFMSEETGYSHLYRYDMTTGKKQALTSGKYEVQRTELSRDKQFFYITTNEVHPGEKQFYRLPAAGGKAERITQMSGSNEVAVSPDQKWLAIRYSYANKPWELYLQENKPGASPQRVTQSLSAEFSSYKWRDPLVTTFKARDGAEVYARVYVPENPSGAAVIFVHGAGYTQNAHKWWASYFREYMFHNLLADKGYTVMDIDYRASAGYGRDWRTGIYRFMGGKDLEDNVDGARWLVEKYNVHPKRIGIYGGSYGGFITLMAMFTTPDVFASGAALRPVTDWAHYNHGYTSDILNEPVTDSIAFAKSSPIYHAEGLKGHLLICHGMVDVNVHFQDAVRLSQRLIELGKDNWELAVYPLEDHGFVEPSSWTDEYKRILKLFETTLRK